MSWRVIAVRAGLRRSLFPLAFCLLVFALAPARAFAAPQHPAHGAKDDHAHSADSADAAASAAPPPPASSAAPATKPEGDSPSEDTPPPAKHELVTMKIGVVVTDITKFDLAAGTFNVEFLALVHCDKEPCKPKINVANGKLSGKPEELHSDKLFKIFKLKAEASAVIDLADYPYDNHELPLVLEDDGDPEQVKYEVDGSASSVRPDIRVPGWDVTEWMADTRDVDDGDGTKTTQLVFDVNAVRPRLAATFKTVIPVVIMLFVAAFTLLLKPKSAAGRLSAATSGLMAVVMFQVGQVGGLPPISYLTRFDKFMIATYVIYLANIGFSVAMVRFDEKKNEKMAELSYLAAAGAVPGLALVAWLLVFLHLV